MYNTLNEIKLQLHDAPVDIKEAFNTIVGYFDESEGYWVFTAQTAGPGGKFNGPIDNFKIYSVKEAQDLSRYINRRSKTGYKEGTIDFEYLAYKAFPKMRPDVNDNVRVNSKYFKTRKDAEDYVKSLK